jgi:hypothetical protein
MKKILLLLCICSNLQNKSFTQTSDQCGTYDNFHLIITKSEYLYTGTLYYYLQMISSGPGSVGPSTNPQSLYNCYYKVDETNGSFVNFYGVATGNLWDIQNSIYGQEGFGAIGVGYDPTPVYRKVNFWCTPTYICPDINQHVPTTNLANASNNWSSPSTWIDNTVPSTSETTILLTKTTNLDVNLIQLGQLLISNTGGAIIAPNVIFTSPKILVRINGLLQNNGTLTGIGKILGSLSNNGIIAPGNSPGLFEIRDNYTATSNAIHNIEIAGLNSYDTIKVGGVLGTNGGLATLNGTLNVTLLNNFIPTLGSTYKIFTFESAVGNFANINLPVLTLGLSWQIQYNTTDVTLKVIAAALPIKLLSFYATLQNTNNAKLQWQIATAEDGSKYELQRSKDGINFTTIITQTGNSIETQFNYIDYALSNGKYYYRLQMLDRDGKITYSNIAVVNVGSKEQLFSVYPNPIKKGESLQINLKNITADKIEIINTLGQVVYSKNEKQTGSISIPIVPTLAQGIYVIKVKSGNEVMTEKLIVQ